MSEADRPRSAFPYAPHCTMPAPWPHPRPVKTAASPSDEMVIHRDGIVIGSEEPVELGGGYRPGSRHGAHRFTAPRKVLESIDRLAPAPFTTTAPPSRRTLEIAFARGHSPAAPRNVARSSNGSRTLQRETAEAPSSRSTTGRRYGSGGLPKTSSFPYVCPSEVEKYTVSAGRPSYSNTSPAVRRTAAYQRRTVGSNGTGIPRYT